MIARTSSMSKKWLQITLFLAVFIMSIYETRVEGQCVPANCDDGNACTNDVCQGTTCVNTNIVCNDNNPCTADTCVAGQCVFTGICTITITKTPAPSVSPIATISFPTNSKPPFVGSTQSSTSTPFPVAITATRSKIPVDPSSPSRLRVASASATAGVPSGFPVQSVTNTISPASSLSRTPTRTTTRTPTSTFIPPTPVFSATGTFSPSPSGLTPSPSTSSVPATPLPFRVGAPLTVLVQLQCTSVDCCSNFVTAWADLVDINDVSLMDLLTCDAINSNLVAITYNQFGSNFYYAWEILSRYWVGARCASIDPLSYAPCFPEQGLLYSYDWDYVIELNVLNADYISTFTTNYSTDDLTFYSFPVYSTTSASFLLSPSFLLFVLSILFALYL